MAGENRHNDDKTTSNENAEYKQEKTPKQRLPDWDETTDVLKVIVANRALIEHGIPYAFTLNPSPKEIKKALAHKDGPKKYFAARISRWLRQELGYVRCTGSSWSATARPAGYTSTAALPSTTTSFLAPVRR
jgi:hypothetical protein